VQVNDIKKRNTCAALHLEEWMKADCEFTEHSKIIFFNSMDEVRETKTVTSFLFWTVAGPSTKRGQHLLYISVSQMLYV